MFNEKLLKSILEKGAKVIQKSPAKALCCIVGALTAITLIYNTEEGKPLHDFAEYIDKIFKNCKDDSDI